MVSTIATVLIHSIVVVFHTGIVSRGQIHQERENSTGNLKQSYGILMVRCPKLVKLIQRHVFTGHFDWSILLSTRVIAMVGPIKVTGRSLR